MQTLTHVAKPKMQLGIDVPVSDEFRREINSWMADFFGYENDEAPQPAPTNYNDGIAVPVEPNKAPDDNEVKPKAKRAPSKTQEVPAAETLAELLEGLKDSFHTMRLPDMRESWLEERHVRALKKLGVYIPDGFRDDAFADQKIDPGIRLPSIASALLNRKKEDTGSKLYPRFIYAIKHPKLPEGVEPTRGTPFQFGACFELSRGPTGNKIKPKIFWSWCWIVVAPDGAIVIPNEVRVVSEVVRHKRPGPGPRTSTVYNKLWCAPSFVHPEPGQTLQRRCEVTKGLFAELVRWWDSRSSKWSVGVRKDGHRCTFSIDHKHTAAYFADRNAVVNVDGKPKKIIHFVRPHIRANGQQVKAHVRGLREFDWKGYHCVVTAPDLKGSNVTALFTLPPVAEDDGQYGELMEIDQVAEQLAATEDT